MVFVSGLSISHAHTVYITRAEPRDYPLVSGLRDFILKTELIPVLYELIDTLAIFLTEIKFDVEEREN